MEAGTVDSASLLFCAVVRAMSARVASHPGFFVTKCVGGAPLDAVLRGHPRLPIPVVQTVLLEQWLGQPVQRINAFH